MFSGVCCGFNVAGYRETTGTSTPSSADGGHWLRGHRRKWHSRWPMGDGTEDDDKPHGV